jgi:folate-binding protein YgfZ
MPTAHLHDRSLIRLLGTEAEHFLQNIVTLDLDTLKAGEARPGALLTPQGKILFDFLVSRDGADTLVLECRADVADDFFRRLMMYRLRAKVEISKPEQTLVAITWGDEAVPSSPDSTALRDLRFPSPVLRTYGASRNADATTEEWRAFRIANGVAESGADYALGDAFPHDVLLDQNGGVGFRKGCYVGQEVVSRMQHRGTARRRVLTVSGQAQLPAPGTEITVGGRPVGTLGSTAGRQGIAILRIDKVKDALDAGTAILAGDVPLDVAIPGWAAFTWPSPSPAGES